jgi:hypothetical protein
MKLYLFYSAANREAFLLAKAEAMTRAESNWAVLSKDLIGPQPEAPVAAATMQEAEPSTNSTAASH